MADKRRVYIIRYGSEAPEDEIFSSMKKLKNKLNKDISYSALGTRLRRAKERTGKSKIRIKDEDGNTIIVEIREIE